MLLLLSLSMLTLLLLVDAGGVSAVVVVDVFVDAVDDIDVVVVDFGTRDVLVVVVVVDVIVAVVGDVCCRSCYW